MTSFTQMQCGECGIEFCVPDAFYKERRENRRDLGWYCPNGHSRVFKESVADELRRERDRLRQQIAQRDDEIAAERKRTAAAKGEATKLRKRVGNGVCPCCTRSFTNLKRHIATKHPDYNVVPFEAVAS